MFFKPHFFLFLPAVLLVFAHVFLMSSIYAFFFMNVYNYLYAAYYLPNGMEFEPRGKRDVFISLGVLYIITILPLFLPWRSTDRFMGRLVDWY